MNQITKKKKKAFTLIELIIVLAIMAIIAAIAIPNFMAVRDNSRNKADIQSCATIKRTVLMLVSDGSIAAGAITYNITVPNGAVTSNPTNATLTTALKDVNTPQGNPTGTSTGIATAYHIAINDAGDVTVTTIIPTT